MSEKTPIQESVDKMLQSREYLEFGTLKPNDVLNVLHTAATAWEDAYSEILTGVAIEARKRIQQRDHKIRLLTLCCLVFLGCNLALIADRLVQKSIPPVEYCVPIANTGSQICFEK